MKLRIDTSQMLFQVGANGPVPKTDANQNQRSDKATNNPLWTIDLVAYDQVPNGRGELETDTIRVTVASSKQPQVNPMEAVSLSDLEAIAWSMDKKSGISYRASAVEPVQASSAKSAPAKAA